MILKTLRSNRGSAFATVFIVMTFTFILGMAYLSFTTNNLMRSRNDEKHATAFYLAEAAMEYTIGQITDSCGTSGPHIAAQTFDATTLLSGLRAGTSGNVTVTPDSGSDNYATLIASATYEGMTESIRVRLNVKNVGIWNNAIFAGIGQSGLGINGNVDIRGSVHILGSGESFSDLNGNGVWDPGEPYIDSNGNGVYDPPLTASSLATSLSGTADIGNNYNGMPAGLQNKIPVLPLVNVGGEMVQSLNAELRVKHGTVNISGNATIGQPNVTGNGSKETLDGCYVTNGFGGNKGTSSVYSDNGTSNGYDLADRVSFPNLYQSYTDPSTGQYYTTYGNYLTAKGLTIPVTSINGTTPSFSSTDGINSISWNQYSGVLTIQGIVHIPSSLDLSSQGATIYYSGRGTLYTDGDVRVHGNVLPYTFFPTTDALGVIAGDDIDFATGSGEAQLSAMGAWFAQDEIVSAKQSQFVGSFVANYFDMGTNVPSIYQVPSLADNLPPGLPGNKPIIVAQILSWRHL